jgi:spoIIIJ-associated protein
MNESRSIEASGPDIEAAISSGIAELGVTRADVIVEIVEEPSRGILGLGARPARVRLTVIRAPVAPAPPAPVAPSVAPVSSSAAAQSAKAEPASAPKPAGSYEPSERSRPDNSNRSNRYERRRDEPRREHREHEVDEDWTSDSLTEDELAEDAKIGAETLQELLKQMQVEATVITRRATQEDDEAQHWSLEIQGRDLGALIGRRGETLAALQYITRLIASRDLERRVNIVIDVEGYKSRRESLLRRLAKRMADQAVQRGRTVSLEPMPPHERRIIHLALRDNPNVTTESVGDGDRRKVTIVPRKQK